MKRFLNVGGNSKAIPVPPFYDGWEHVLLDIDASVAPDVVCDARELSTLPAGTYDSIYCSHNLEHYRRHEVPKVLAGFRHLLTADGFTLIRVPDVGAVMRIVAQHDLDVDSVLYQSPAGPITVHDVLYGYGVEIESSGNDFFAHKCGFTRKLLRTVLRQAGFEHIYMAAADLELSAFAFTRAPSAASEKALGIA